MNKKKNEHYAFTHECIRTALLALLDRKPLEKISVREICELAEINHSTFYAHYQSVYDLMNEIEELLWRDHIQLMKDAGIEQGRFLEPESIRLFLSYIYEHRRFYNAWIGQISNNSSLDRFVKDVRQAQENYHIWRCSDLQQLQYAAAFFFGGAMKITEHWLNSGCKETPDHLAAVLAGLVPGELKLR